MTGVSRVMCVMNPVTRTGHHYNTILHLDHSVLNPLIQGWHNRIKKPPQMILSYISEMMTLAFDTKWANTGQLKVKFRSPVLSGESIETYGNLLKTSDDNNFKKAFYKVGINNINGSQVITGEAIIYY